MTADVHANLPALEATFRALTPLAPDLVLCLGDTVGYNAQPADCLELVLERCDIVLAGNHDVDIATGRHLTGTNDVARAVQQWTRDALPAATLETLAQLPPVCSFDGWLAHHGSFLGGDPTTGYVTSTMLEDNLRAIRARGDVRLALCGHSHVPLAGWIAGEECTEAQATDADEVRWPASADVVLLNPGAVGQPRDGDPRASFAVIDTERRTARWHRVAYDVERTIGAIHDASLPAVLATRLKEGR